LPTIACDPSSASWGLRQDHGHRLADLADLVDGEDRLILKGWTVIRIGMTVLISWLVTTRCTPSTAGAALVSILRMRPCAIALRKILP